MNKINTFSILVFAGLGKIAVKELSICNPTNVMMYRLQNYDYIIFTIDDFNNLRKLSYLRISEDVFALLGNEIIIKEKKDLSLISKSLKKEDIIDCISIKNEIFGKKGRHKVVKLFSFVKQDKDRTVHRKQIADKISSIVKEFFPKWKISDPANIEFWGMYIDEKLYTNIRLSDYTMRYHNSEPSLRQGSLRPTIASAMVYTLNPNDSEIVVDPMCGTGTIIREGLKFNKSAVFYGGDIDESAIVIAKAENNFNNLFVWDALNLPFKKGELDCIITNLPFGKQYSNANKNRSLYYELLKHWSEKLKTNGRMCLLTSDEDSIKHNLDKLGFRWNIAFKVKILGLWAMCYNVYKH